MAAATQQQTSMLGCTLHSSCSRQAAYPVRPPSSAEVLIKSLQLDLNNTCGQQCPDILTRMAANNSAGCVWLMTMQCAEGASLVTTFADLQQA
jgi:hypothetical protein